MRIVFAADTYKPYISGVTHYLSQYKSRLEEMGHEVRLVTFGGKQAPVERGVYYNQGFQLSSGYAFGLRYTQPSLDLLRGADLIHLHQPFVSGQLVLRAIGKRPIPLVFTAHTRYDLYLHDYLPWLPQRFGLRGLSVYMRAFCSRMDRVICNSAASELGMRNCGVEGSLAHLPNGVAMAPFQGVRRDDALRARLAGNQKTLLLYVGRLALDKNIPLLFQAFDRLRRAVLSVQLVMVGTGPAALQLQELAARMGIAAQVTFTGLIPYAQLPAYFASADAFVMPSLHDSHPLAVLEALGAGLPVVAVESPAYGEMVFNGQNGVLTAADTAAFARGLEMVCADPDLRKRMGQCSREFAQRFDIQRTAVELADLYQTVITERQGA
jgi:1,2-diacylglycerol 3-alpha-glucosyltransferase